jgi:hypothetical protein
VPRERGEVRLSEAARFCGVLKWDNEIDLVAKCVARGGVSLALVIVAIAMGDPRIPADELPPKWMCVLRGGSVIAVREVLVKHGVRVPDVEEQIIVETKIVTTELYSSETTERRVETVRREELAVLLVGAQRHVYAYVVRPVEGEERYTIYYLPLAPEELDALVKACGQSQNGS